MMDEKELEHRLTDIENRSKSNTHRLEACEKDLEKTSELVASIKELALEVKHMRETLNETIARLNKLENKDLEKWDKFKWLIVTGLVTGVIGFILGALGLG